MARKTSLILLILVFSFGPAKLSLAFISCNEKPACCQLAENTHFPHGQKSPSAKPPGSCGYHESCSCNLQKETASDSRDLAHHPRELAKTWKKLKYVSSASPSILRTDKIKAEEENPAAPNLYRSLSVQDLPLRC